MNDSNRHEPAVGFSNAQRGDLLVWFEPWCDEIALPPHGELTIFVDGEGDVPELDAIEDRVVVYGSGATRLQVYVNGVKQETGSSLITVPDTDPLSTRQFIDTVFGAFPEARPGGRPLQGRRFGRWLFEWLFELKPR